MTDNDDKLIRQFMQTNKREIADNGFSRKVSQRLSRQAQWVFDVLNGICIIICCALFYMFHGFDYLFRSFYELMTMQSHHWMNYANLPSLLIAGVVFFILWIQRLYSTE